MFDAILVTVFLGVVISSLAIVSTIQRRAKRHQREYERRRKINPYTYFGPDEPSKKKRT